MCSSKSCKIADTCTRKQSVPYPGKYFDQIPEKDFSDGKDVLDKKECRYWHEKFIPKPISR
jgi:hypothetical protein